MVRSRLGLKALSLSVILIGTLAFTSAVQAEPTAFWLANFAKFSGGLSPTVEAETDVVGTLLTELTGKFIHLKCKVIKLVGAHLVEPVAQFLGKALFHECDSLSLKTAGGELVLQSACEPSVGASKGLIETNSITGLIVLHEGKGSLELKPTTAGGLFATVNLGEECAFGSALKVGGVFFLEDTGFSSDAAKHLVKELSALTKLVINEGSKTATIDGSAWTFLGGAHKAMTFSGQPVPEKSGTEKFWLVNGAQFTTSRNLSADGNRVFFQTAHALLPADTNGQGGCPLVRAAMRICTDTYGGRHLKPAQARKAPPTTAS
jgi:hypothetical protein